MLKTQQISLFFEDMQDNVEEVLKLSHNFLGELQSPSLKYIVPAAKRNGADLFENGALEIGEVVSGRKKLKTFAKDVGTKTVRKQLGVEKIRNTSKELVELNAFLKKIDKKTVALAKTFLTTKNECKPKSFSVRGLYKFFIGSF